MERVKRVTAIGKVSDLIFDTFQMPFAEDYDRVVGRTSMIRKRFKKKSFGSFFRSFALKKGAMV